MSGVTAEWTDAPGAYSAADGWRLRYALRHPSHPRIDLLSTASGTDHQFTIPATGTGSTSEWRPGVYSWRAWVERTAERHEVGSGEIEVIVNFAETANVDGRTMARRALDDARAAFAAWTPTRRRYRIGERELEFSDTAEIIRTIHYWQAEVEREDMLAGRRRELGRRIYTRL